MSTAPFSVRRLAIAVLQAALVGFACPALVVLVSLGQVLFFQPTRWEVDGGHRGWVLVRYEDPSCPPSVRDGRTHVIAVDAHGRGCTSEPLPDGWYADHISVGADGNRVELRATGWGGGGEIWGEATQRRRFDSPFAALTFFVGTEEEFRSAHGAPHG